MSKKKRKPYDFYYQKQQENKPIRNWDLIEKILIVLSLGIYFLLLPPFFKNLTLAGHDVGSHLTYLRIFTDALSQGQFPVRWIEWVQGGQNQPLFNFYQPLLYYIAQIPHLFGADILNSLHQTILFLWLFSGFLTFLFVRNLTKNNLASVVSSALYVFAPYHILDVFVRTAYPEATALAFAPGLFFAIERYFTTGKRYYLGLLALFLAAVFTSHPPTLIMFSFPLVLYFIYLLFKDYKNGLKSKLILIRGGFTLFGLAMGGGLAAFFAIPAFLQQNLINSSSLNAGYLDFHNHYACLLQLIWSSWGFGTSVQGCLDNISFQVGIINWLIFISAITILFTYFYLKKQINSTTQALFWIIIAFFGMYMTLSFSQPFWEGVPYVSFLQFPWRFLSVVIFAIAVLGGIIFTFITNKKQQLGLFVILIIAIPALSFNYLKPAAYLAKDYFAQDSPDFYKGLANAQRNDTAELGYMPKYAEVLPDPQTVSTLEIKTLDTDAKIAVVKNTFVNKEYVLIVPKKTRAVLYIHYFPGWKFSVNGKEVKANYVNIYGFPYINLPTGQSQVKAWFTDTPIVMVANLISLLSFIILMIFVSTSFGKIKLKSKLPANREEI
jgi:hypothetical protein